ncbi:NTP transferase domain-containing protein [Psychrobacter alimentarius]|uniref:NTP transferase domain-containing protein n=1 Tax=Psychrobacter alimentarius TaxID=261164 RepID=UPI00191A20A4|nr:NTP transferase domain-containing protein [Psychrobacter alimentarius]
MSGCVNDMAPHTKKTLAHAVILLASGLSQRLGQAKQLLNKNGDALIEVMLKLAVTTQPRVITVIIPDHNAITNAVADLAAQYPIIQMVVNPQPETGMAHSLYLGIEALSDVSLPVERVLIMGVDQILLDESHLTALLAGSQAVVASEYDSWTYVDKMYLDDHSVANPSAKRIIGLPLIINDGLLRQWQSALTGDKGLRYLIRALPPSQISTVTNDQLSYDIDTPEQLAYAQQKGWLDKQL